MTSERRTASHRGQSFTVLRGSTHPEYSFFTFSDEEKEFREHYWNVNEGEVVVDAGASYGAYALSACVLGATVHAFEPEPSVHRDLVQNIVENGWEKRCFAHCYGLWSSTTILNMGKYAPHWPKAGITDDYKMVTLDDYVNENQIDWVDWIKIDVEGAEIEALKGARETIERFQPRLIVECHIFLDDQLERKAIEILDQVGIRTFEVISRPPCTMIVTR